MGAMSKPGATIPDLGHAYHAPPLPLPWSAEDIGACFVVKHHGQKLGYFYYEKKPGRPSSTKQLTKDEAGGSRPTWQRCRHCYLQLGLG
jgi:hypothetical protein